VARPVIFLMMLLFPELGLPVNTRKRSFISGTVCVSVFSIFSIESRELVRVQDVRLTGSNVSDRSGLR
jgi:hypothetical protein